MRNLAQVIARTSQKHVDCILHLALQEVLPQKSVVFHMANHRILGVTALELFLDGCAYTTLSAGNPDLGPHYLIARITAINIHLTINVEGTQATITSEIRCV